MIDLRELSRLTLPTQRQGATSIERTRSEPHGAWRVPAHGASGQSHSGEMDFANFSFKQLNEKGFCIVGSANTVRDRLSQYSRELGHGLILALTHFGDMPNERTRQNMARFAGEVMPPLRAEFSHMA